MLCYYLNVLSVYNYIIIKIITISWSSEPVEFVICECLSWLSVSPVDIIIITVRITLQLLHVSSYIIIIL